MGTTKSDTTALLTDTITDSQDSSVAMRSFNLPDEPLTTIQANKSNAVDLKELWKFRELLYFLTWRDLKIRYKQTSLGVMWVILQPFLTMLIFTIFFGKLAGLDKRTGDIPYAIFAFSGLLPWTFFANAVSASSNSLVGNTHLITKVYFPRLFIPGATVLAGLVDFAIAFVVLVGLLFYYSVTPAWTIVLLPLLGLWVMCLAFGVGVWLATLNVKYRDIRFALPFLIQLWMFVSPIIYPSNFVPERWRWLLLLNPMTGIIEAFRASLFGHNFNYPALATSAVITLGLLLYSVSTFKRMEKSFADII